MAKTKVALVLSGGTSAGAYIAGALDELMRAFAASDRYEIDIIAGASAGATTGALIAHGLCHRNGETALYDVWVEQIDIVELLAPDLAPDDPVTVLSPTRLRQVANETITWPADGGPGTRAAFCADTLTMAMTLANATPLPYASRLRQQASRGLEKFVQYRHAEQETFELGLELAPDDPVWNRIVAVAQASAAIPLVFPMVQLTRNPENPKHYIMPPDFDGERTFWYYDGGTYNNLPIDLAWHLIAQLPGADDGPPTSSQRRVVVINPWRNEPTVPAASAPYPNLLRHAANLLRDIRTESRTIQFDDEVIRRSLESEAAAGSIPESLIGVRRPTVDVLDTFALVIPSADDPPLRCLYLNALSAFLDRRFREHDFRRGAADARRVAIDLLGITAYEQRPADFYQPDAGDPFGPEIGDYATLATIPSTRDPDRSVRRVFEDALSQRIETLAGRLDLPVPGFLRDDLIGAIFSKFVGPRLPGLWNSEDG